MITNVKIQVKCLKLYSVLLNSITDHSPQDCVYTLYLVQVELAHNYEKINMNKIRQEQGMDMGLVPFYSTH